MSALVVDASMALSWCFKDEASAASDAIFALVGDEGAVVPMLWHVEVGNALLQGERRGRIPIGETSVRLALIGELPIETDLETASRAWREILALARSEKLTTYDAAYLELAMRRGLPLSTKDDALRGAARRQGLKVVP